MGTSLGRQLAEALAAKDPRAMRALLSDEIDFKGLTPGRLWEGTSPDDVVEATLGHWFGPDDDIRALVAVADGEQVVDTSSLTYRLAVRNADGDHLVEQQAYYRVRDGEICHLRMLCSGYRPTGEPHGDAAT